jgi:hypothetical protein
MPKLRKKAAPDAPPPPRLATRFYPPRSELVYVINRVYEGGDEVDLHVPGTNLERFRVRTDALTYVERKPQVKTSNPFTTPEPVFDGGELAGGYKPSNATASSFSMTTSTSSRLT